MDYGICLARCEASILCRLTAKGSSSSASSSDELLYTSRWRFNAEGDTAAAGWIDGATCCCAWRGVPGCVGGPAVTADPVGCTESCGSSRFPPLKLSRFDRLKLKSYSVTPASFSSGYCSKHSSTEFNLLRPGGRRRQPKFR